MLTVLISGANGFISRNFQQKFKEKYKFIPLSHTTHSKNITIPELEQRTDLIKEVDVILNLAGANIGAKRWSDNRKHELLDSRISTTQKLINLFNKHNPGAHFISASAIGIYETNLSNNEETKINYNHYSNFSQEITKKWEQVALQYQGKLTITRFGVVLANNGGAFPQMLRPFLFCIGGQLGDGKQYFPWIALPDLLNALDQIISQQIDGIYNLTSPQIITNTELSTQISKIWNRPNWLHLPRSLIKIIFGQMGEELFLNSTLVYPDKLLKFGFNYNFAQLQDCLMAIKNKQF